MSRTPARFTQADIARAIRAARQSGAGEVVICPDGAIIVRLAPSPADAAPHLAPDENIVL
jgi:hypothetical protein